MKRPFSRANKYLEKFRKALQLWIIHQSSYTDPARHDKKLKEILITFQKGKGK